MYDRFKFRAFDTFAEKMIQNHISICEGELYEWCPDGLHIKHDIGDSAIVMQCTGLKDKNDKLIYEGDIVKFKNEILVVRFQQEMACFAPQYYANGEYCGRLFFDEYDSVENEFYKSTNFEVIGNIYENKELLECH